MPTTDGRRWTCDSRRSFASGARGPTSACALNNLFNTSYATGYNATYNYTLDTAPRPSGWATPTTIYNPRFVRLNFTVNF